MAPLLQPSQVAARLGVDPATIRRWCEWHASHLSEGASPVPGGQRRLTEKDVQVLQEVQRLRLAGLKTQDINEQLAGTTFAEVTDTEGAAIAPDAPGTDLAPVPVSFDVQALQGIIAPLQEQISELKAKQNDRVSVFIAGLAIGLVVASVFFLIVVLLIRP